MAIIYSHEIHKLKYFKPATTSRGALHDRKLWLIKAIDSKNPNLHGTGECGIIPKLSPEDRPDFEETLTNVISQLNSEKQIDPHILHNHPALQFAIETALLDLKNGGQKKFYDNPYSRKEAGIKINGLVWMSTVDEMEKEALQKLEEGFDCLKFKVGAQDFDNECRMLEKVRKLANHSKLQIRLDANGAFAPDDALIKLKELSKFSIHSIEQPIAKNQWDLMEEVCSKSKINIALDEELIGINLETLGKKMLQKIKPHFIILKPSLLGGLNESDKWINLASDLGIEWWATSALESNIGLNAIAQWLASKPIKLHQGLGTGKLYAQNFEPYTEIKEGFLWLAI